MNTNPEILKSHDGVFVITLTEQTAVISSNQVKRLLMDFELYYGALDHEKKLDEARNAFRIFWQNKMMTDAITQLNDIRDLDPIIRILDTAGKRTYSYDTAADRDSLKQLLLASGKQYGILYDVVEDAAKKRLTIRRSFAIANCMVKQNVWREMFRAIKTDDKLRSKLNAIFTEPGATERIVLINDLQRLDANRKSALTRPAANALNVMLFCHNPSTYTSVVSLTARKTIIAAFELGVYQDNWSYGEQVIHSSSVLLKGFGDKYHANLSPRKISVFFYWEYVQPLWDIGSKGTTSEISPSKFESAPIKLSTEMPVFHELEEPEKKEIGELVKLAQDGEIGIPDFQRRFVWTRPDIIELLESILRGYYVGSLLLWSIDGESPLKVTPVFGTNIPEEKLKPRFLVLDGQQRISSIYYATMAPNQPLWNTKQPYVFFIDLRKILEFEKHNEPEGLVASISRKEAEKTGLMGHTGQFQRLYFPISEFHNFHEWISEYEDSLRGKLDVNQEKVPEIRKKLREYLRHIWEKFEIPIIKLPKNMSLVDVAKIFEKLNSTGADLTVFDLFNARMIKYQIHPRQLWETARENFSLLEQYSEGNERFPVYALQTLALSRDKPVKSEELLELQPAKFDQDWTVACQSIEKALSNITNVRDGYGVISPKWLPYVTMIPVLSHLLSVLEKRNDKPKVIQKIDSWYWSSITTNAYSGATDTQIAMDSKQLVEWFEDDAKIPRTVTEARTDLNNLNLRLVNRTSDAIYKGIMCLMAKHGGRDFVKVKMVELSTLDDHHIFPKSRAKEFKASAEINSIANKTLLAKETNEYYIRNSRPSEYLARIMKDQGISEGELMHRLETHLISPKAFGAMLVDNFEEFVADREKSYKDTLSQYIDKP